MICRLGAERKVRSALLAWLSLTLSSTSGLAQNEAKCIYGAFEPTVGVIAADQSNNAQPIATGFVVSKDGYLITAAPAWWHGDSSWTSFRVHLGGGAALDLQATHVSHTDHLMLLQLPHRATPYAFAPVAPGAAMSVGDPLFLIGYPRDFDLTIEVGGAMTSRNAYIKRGLTAWWQTNMSIMDGMVGSPITDASGQVVGVAIKESEDFSNVGYALPISEASDLLAKAGVAGAAAAPCKGSGAVGATESTAAFKECRDPSHGIEKWSYNEEITDSGITSEDVEPEEWYSKLHPQVPGHSDLQTEVVESERRHVLSDDSTKNDQYKYTCKIRMRGDPVFVLKKSSACGS